MIDIKAQYESSNMTPVMHISCTKYRNLNNISHYHSDFELIYVNEGNATVFVYENFFHLDQGECLFVNSGDIHHIRSDASTVITVLKASSKYFEKIFASKRLSSPKISNTSNLELFLHKIGSEIKLNADNFNIVADCLATQLFVYMLRSEKTTMNKNEDRNKAGTNELYSTICKKISNEYNTITFEEASAYMHFSKPYFSKVFHSLFGMTFTRYLNTVKTAKAIELLKEGKLNITAISVECGFTTHRNFNRVFKDLTGYAPNELPSNYVFLYNLHEGYGLDPTLNCTEILS